MSEVRLLQLAKLILAVGWASVIVFIAVSTIPDSPLSASLRHRVSVVAVMPEGWAFFTRNPREAFTQAYKRAADGTWERIGEPNFSKRHWFGLDRTGRLITNELGALLSGIASERWTECSGPVGQCMERLMPEATV